MIGYIFKRNVVLFFAIGFFIGFALEIMLNERGVPAALYSGFQRIAGSRRELPTVSCVIFLHGNHGESLAASENTWLKKCDDFMAVKVHRSGRRRTGSKDNVNIESPNWINCDRGGGDDDVDVDVDDDDDDDVCRKTERMRNVTANSAWSGLCKALQMVNSSDSKWFVLSPSNLLVLVENLKEFVRDLDPDEGHYFGHAIRHYDADFNALSAGILISRGALRRLMERFESEDRCDATGKFWRNEDMYLGKFLKEIGIVPKDTRDDEGRGRFHGYNIDVLVSPGKLFNQSDYKRKALFPVPTGLNCCSPHLITINVANPDKMYHHYFYIYKLSTGVSSKDKTDATGAESKGNGFNWKEFLRKEGYNESSIGNMTAEEYYEIWAKKITPESLYEKMRREFGSQ